MLVSVVAGAIVAVTACTSAPSASTSDAGSHAEAPPATAPVLTVGKRAWVNVTVATLWRTPSSPRPVDAPALAHPAGIVDWLSAMTLAQRRGLNGRADTQALLGDPVRVLRLRPHWARVAALDQPTPDNRHGYPGWVPRRQLTPVAPATATQLATVTGRTAWLRTDDAAATKVLQVSFGTRLPVLGQAGELVVVGGPGGTVWRITAAQVAVHARGEPALPATRRGLVRTARSFVGLDYLWAGRSGFGFDCSGLTSLDYRVHGLVIPRDTGPQSEGGRSVPTARLARGDLLFYATAGHVHHVSMYVGNAMMVHAPHTGSTVQVIAMSTPAYAREYAGARRYLP